MRLLAVSGSLRAVSTNAAALGALARLAPPGVAVTFYAGLATLPAFNPDDDRPPLPAAVAAWRAAVAAADALAISSPEYARGVPGALKNALDWLVSGPEMPHKPVLLINTSPRATHAQDSLALILRTMSARLAGETVTLPLLGRALDAAAIAADPALAGGLRAGVAALQAVADDSAPP